MGIERAHREIERADLVLLVVDPGEAPTLEDPSASSPQPCATGAADRAPAGLPPVSAASAASAAPDAEAANRAAGRAMDAVLEEYSVELGRTPDIIAINKIDRMGAPAGATTSGGSIVRISATRGDGLRALESSIVRRLEGIAPGNAPRPSVSAPGSASAARLPAASAPLSPAASAPNAVPTAYSLQPTASADLSLAVNLRHSGLLGRAGLALESARRGFEKNVSGELVMIDLREALDALGDILGAGAGVQTADALLDLIFSRFCIGK